MANRLNAGGNPGRPMQVGETRTYQAKNHKTGETGREYTVHRTTRDYVYDLCDAYNASRTRTDVEWFVDSSGNLKLGEPIGWSAKRTNEIAKRQEAERREWMRRNGDMR